jgi:hypothetical protein
MTARMIADTRNTKAARARRTRRNQGPAHGVPPELRALISEMFLDALLGDLDNWKPIGILSAPVGGTRVFANGVGPADGLSPHAHNAGSRT